MLLTRSGARLPDLDKAAIWSIESMLVRVRLRYPN